MNGELAQVIALATHGTSWLRAPDTLPPDLQPHSTTFRFVRSATFTDERRRAPWWRRTHLGDAASWLAHLRDTDARRLFLVMSDGGWWLASDASQQWVATWEVGDPDAVDQRIWDVHYRGLARRVAPPRGASLEIAAARLRHALTGALDFATEQNLAPWSELFAGALQALDSPDPEHPHHVDLVPRSWPESARRLLVAASQAWVFGGMGSWNDLGFEDPDDDATYASITSGLYAAILASLVAAVNIES